MGSRKAAVLHNPAWTPSEQASRLLLYMLTYTKFCLMSMNRSRIPYFWSDCRSNGLYFTHSTQGKGDGKLTVPPQSSPAVPLGCCNGSAVYPRRPAKAIAGTGGEGPIGTVPAAFPGQESKSGGTHGVYHCLPVDHFPQGEFLRRHKARGAVHPPHGVDKRSGTVLVQIAEQGAV